MSVFLSQASKLAEDMMNICQSLSTFENYFPKPSGSDIDMAVVHDAFCQAVGINVTVLMEQVISGVEGLQEFVSVVCLFINLVNVEPNTSY